MGHLARATTELRSDTWKERLAKKSEKHEAVLKKQREESKKLREQREEQERREKVRTCWVFVHLFATPFGAQTSSFMA